VTPADLAKVPISAKAGKAVRLGDVATVAQRYQPLIGDAVIDGKPGLLLVVEKLPWANSLQMTADVEQALKDLQPGLPGITFDTKVFQQADFVKLAIANLTQALVLGFVLVVVILGLFLFEWRVALISLLTIPLSLVATMLVLYWRGATINTMTLAGLVIALGAVGGRRDHRRGEHHPAAAGEPAHRWRALHGHGRAAGLPGGAEPRSCTPRSSSWPRRSRSSCSPG